jgi:hypothetical protein
MKALLHGGPLKNTWWDVGDTPPGLLVLQDGLAAALRTDETDREMVLVGDFPVPAGGSRYELLDGKDGRTIYGWAPDERAELEHIAVFDTGPAATTRIDILGLTDAYPFMRMAPIERMDGVQWVHVAWHDPRAFTGEVLYELNVLLRPSTVRRSASHAIYRERLPLPVMPNRVTP